MSRHAFLELRKAVADDFKDSNGYPFYGAVYFIQNHDLTIGKKLHYLKPETNKVEFKALYNEGRIWTFANPDEVIKVTEVSILEWNEEIIPAVDENLETSFEMVSEVKELDFKNK